jgi:hypothetical protein
MCYSKKEFPFKLDLTKILKEIWNNGWFNEYSKEHFLIKALNGDLSDFRRKELSQNEAINLYKSCDNPNIFLIILASMLHKLKSSCSTEEFRRFIEQMAAGKDNYEESQFWATINELQALHFMTLCGRYKVEYEPEIGGESGKRNPEYRINNRFIIPGESPDKPLIPMADYIFDVEVKTILGAVNERIDKEKPYITPLLTIDYKKRETLEKICKENGFQVAYPDVIHMKDFLNSAADKFELPTNENHFNILFLNWSFRELSNAYLEPLAILDNQYNGLWRYPQTGIKFQINKDVYDKISAIVIYNLPIQGLMFNDIRWAMSNRHYSVLFNSSLTSKQQVVLSRLFSFNPKQNTQYDLCLLSSGNTSYICDSINQEIKKIMFI